MSQQIQPSQLRIVNDKTTELAKIVYYQPDLFLHSTELQQDMIYCFKAYFVYLTWHTATVSQYLAGFTPALQKQLRDMQERVRQVRDEA